MSQATAIKTVTIKVRVDPSEKRELEWAARQNGLPLSVWMRSMALKEARTMGAATRRRTPPARRKSK
jgi:uncharacterized protein (DUF1778 family)